MCCSVKLGALAVFEAATACSVCNGVVGGIEESDAFGGVGGRANED